MVRDALSTRCACSMAPHHDRGFPVSNHASTRSVERADHSSPTPIQDVGVDQRGGNIGVTEELL